jgi:hypothetical protein
VLLHEGMTQKVGLLGQISVEKGLPGSKPAQKELAELDPYSPVVP